jgi:Na+/melibiose symporter-like transporter
MTLKILAKDVPSPNERLDWLGLVLLSPSLAAIIFGLAKSNEAGGFTAPEVLIPIIAGALVLAVFFLYVQTRERHGRTPLVSPSLFKNRTSNLGLTTQTVQWLVLQGVFFVISVFLQQERGYSAIQTGLMLVPATVGILTSSAMAQRMASRHPQRLLIRSGFTLTIVGLALLMALARQDSAVWTFWPGLFLMGFGVGAMLTASVNVVQSAWPEKVQGDISGVSRSVSNLGSSLGVAIAGSVLVAATAGGNPPFLTAIVVVECFALIGWLAALLLPRAPRRAPAA